MVEVDARGLAAQLLPERHLDVVSAERERAVADRARAHGEAPPAHRVSERGLAHLHHLVEARDRMALGARHGLHAEDARQQLGRARVGGLDERCGRGGAPARPGSPRSRARPSRSARAGPGTRAASAAPWWRARPRGGAGRRRCSAVIHERGKASNGRAYESVFVPGRIHVEKEGALGWLIFDHPERRNAISHEMWEALPRPRRRSRTTRRCAWSCCAAPARSPSCPAPTSRSSRAARTGGAAAGVYEETTGRAFGALANLDQARARDDPRLLRRRRAGHRAGGRPPLRGGRRACSRSPPRGSASPTTRAGVEALAAAGRTRGGEGDPVHARAATRPPRPWRSGS